MQCQCVNLESMILMEHFDVSVVQPLVGKGQVVFIEVLCHYGRKLVDSRCHQHAVNQPTEQHFSNIYLQRKERKEIYLRHLTLWRIC